MVLDPDRSEEQERHDAGLPEQPGESPGFDGRPSFPHPQWMVGVVLIFAVLFIVAGLGDPIWLLIGSPCILVLIVYVWVRLAARGGS